MTVNRVEDRLIGMIDAKWSRLEKQIQWLAHQGKTPYVISKELNLSIDTVRRVIEKGKME
jgi:hypothetical protein